MSICLCFCMFIGRYSTVNKCLYICIYMLWYIVYVYTAGIYVSSPLSGAECSCGLVVWHALGFDAFCVVVVHHLVRDFCQNTLRQGGWGGLEIERQTEELRVRGHHSTHTHHWPCVMPEFSVEPDAVKGLFLWDWWAETSATSKNPCFHSCVLNFHSLATKYFIWKTVTDNRSPPKNIGI